jgi:Na+-translocating ferredoxin:NAD+ oxidoreductase RnfG subunit
MDKALFRAYVKELVKEQIEESVERAVRKILPEVLNEAVAEIKTQTIRENTEQKQRPKPSRAQLAQMLGLERHGDTITATTGRMGEVMPAPPGIDESNPVYKAINKDYSQLMKAMKIT